MGRQATLEGGHGEALGAAHGVYGVEVELIDARDRLCEGVNVIWPRQAAGLAVQHGLERRRPRSPAVPPPAPPRR